MTVSQLRRQMGRVEFLDWMAFDRIDPIGNERIIWQMASMMHLWIMSQSRRGAKVPSVSDLVLSFDAKPEKQSIDDMKAVCQMVAAMSKRKHGSK